MPRGGKRPGAGRKKGSATRRTRAAADAAAANPEIKLPLDHMLDVLNNPTSTQARKDRAAECLLPFLHPRLSAVMTSALGGQGGNNGNNSERLPDIIYSIPRGAQFAADRRTLIWADGTPAAPIVQEPYKSTPMLELTNQSEPKPVAERLEVTEIDTSNVTVLRRRDDDQGA